jgi:hypothetical protein
MAGLMSKSSHRKVALIRNLRSYLLFQMIAAICLSFILKVVLQKLRQVIELEALQRYEG